MKTSLKANLLKHFIAKKEEGGFTLIELLVVIIIIGILAAIALPSFLNQANKAKQSEAKTYIGSINRAQQANFLESGGFTADITDLGLGIRSLTDNYKYGMELVEVTVGGVADPNGASFAVASPADTDPNADGNTDDWVLDAGGTIKAYLGMQGTGVTDPDNVANSELTTLAVLCEAKKTPKQGGEGGSTTTEVASDMISTVPAEGNFAGTDGTSGTADDEPLCPAGTDPAGWKEISG